MKKRPRIVEKTYYFIYRAAHGAVKDENVKDSILASEDIDEVKWYMENVLHLSSIEIGEINLPATQADIDILGKIKPNQYYIMSKTMKFGRGWHSKDTPDKIKEGWEKIHEYYKDI